MSKPIICLDFDGCIHGYDSGWKGAAIIPDAAVPGIGAYLLRMIPHFRIAVYSSRSRSLRGRRAMKLYVRAILWDACMEHDNNALAEAAWCAVNGKPPEWIPWTVYDVRDQADEIARAIEWPWFKPAALITIDDRALTFNGDWSSADYQPDALRRFRPWNKQIKSSSKSSGETPAASRSVSRTQPIPTAST